jgi:hypothetical protein
MEGRANPRKGDTLWIRLGSCPGALASKVEQFQDYRLPHERRKRIPVEQIRPRGCVGRKLRPH